jgi:translocation and assembly module TamA
MPMTFSQRFRKPVALIRLILSFVLLFAPALPAWGADTAELVIEGIEGEAVENVKEALALPPEIVREGKVDLRWLERLRDEAEENGRRALEPFGYYHARISADIRAQNGKSVLHVTVSPGEPVRVTDVDVALRGAGSKEEPLTRLVREFPLRRGDVLLQPEYEKSKNELKGRAQEIGYLDADYAEHTIRIAREENSARVNLVLDTGPRYRFGEVTLEGAPTYPERFLRRYIAFSRGEPFSFAKMGETQLNLANSERFRRVTVTPQKEKAAENEVPVLITLEPAPRRTLKPGIGYGTDTGARFSLLYRDINLWEGAHEFAASLFISENLQGISTRYVVPSPRDIRSSTSIQLNLQREDVTTYTSRLVALEANRNRSFGKGRLGTLYLRLQQEDYTVGIQNSASRLVLPGLRFSEERYDSLLRPTRGHRWSLDLRGAHEYLGSDTGLIQFIGEGSALIPLPWRSSLFLRGKGALTAQEDPLAELPASLRFFAGGDQSVRGYSYRSLGPRDATGQVVGGRHLLVGSVELFRDLFERFAASAFYDVGNAFNLFDNVTIYQGAGVGAHYYSPIGSINLYLARQIWVKTPAFHIHFTVGFQW